MQECAHFNENAEKIAEIKLSYSKLSVGKLCGFRFQRQYLDKAAPTNQVDAGSAVVGIAVHSIMESALMTLTATPAVVGVVPSVRAVLDEAYEAVVAKSALTSQELDKVQTYFPGMEAMVTRLLNFIVNNKCTVYTEIGLALDRQLRPVPFYDRSRTFFSGKLDFVMVAPSGDVGIVDHKTGFKSLAGHEDQLKAYEILAFYALAPFVKRDLGVNIRSIRTGLNFVQDQEIIWTETTPAEMLSTERRQWFIDWVNSISDNVMAGTISRGKHCNWCAYRSYCGSKVGLKKKTAVVSV